MYTILSDQNLRARCPQYIYKHELELAQRLGGKESMIVSPFDRYDAGEGVYSTSSIDPFSLFSHLTEQYLDMKTPLAEIEAVLGEEGARDVLTGQLAILRNVSRDKLELGEGINSGTAALTKANCAPIFFNGIGGRNVEEFVGVKLRTKTPEDSSCRRKRVETSGEVAPQDALLQESKNLETRHFNGVLSTRFKVRFMECCSRASHFLHFLVRFGLGALQMLLVRVLRTLALVSIGVPSTM